MLKWICKNWCIHRANSPWELDTFSFLWIRVTYRTASFLQLALSLQSSKTTSVSRPKGRTLPRGQMVPGGSSIPLRGCPVTLAIPSLIRSLTVAIVHFWNSFHFGFTWISISAPQRQPLQWARYIGGSGSGCWNRDPHQWGRYAIKLVLGPF